MSVKILHGDCLQQMRLLKENTIDVVLTDPPFSSGTRREGAKGIRKSMTRGDDDAAWFGTDSLTTNGFVWLMRECAIEWQRLLKPGAHAFVFIDWRMYPALSGAIESADLRHAGTLIWDKTYFGMGAKFRNQYEMILHFTKGVAKEANRRDVANVIQCKPIRDGEHPTQKPIDLLKTLLSVVATAGDTVLDPFCGSGSTLIAAEQCGCNAIGIERDALYIDVSERRMGRGSLFDALDGGSSS